MVNSVADYLLILINNNKVYMALYGVKWGFAGYNRSNVKRKVKKNQKKC